MRIWNLELLPMCDLCYILLPVSLSDGPQSYSVSLYPMVTNFPIDLNNPHDRTPIRFCSPINIIQSTQRQVPLTVPGKGTETITIAL